MSSKAYKVTMFVWDFENRSVDLIKENLENTRYLSTKVMEISEPVEIPFDEVDSHPLNQNATSKDTFNSLFKDK